MHPDRVWYSRSLEAAQVNGASGCSRLGYRRRAAINGSAAGRRVYTNADRLVQTAHESSLIAEQTGQTGFTAAQPYSRFQLIF